MTNNLLPTTECGRESIKRNVNGEYKEELRIKIDNT